MTNAQRQVLLQSITTVIADYRQNEIPPIDATHVNKWVSQFERFGFDDDAQVVILEQMERILKAYYISRSIAEDFITKVLSSEKLFGSNPAATIHNVQFLRIQNRGSSQNDLLNLCEQILQTTQGISLEDCGSSPVAYIYLDDCLYSGNRVRRDIIPWLSNAVRGTVLHLIFFASHTDGLEYSKNRVEQEAQRQDISVKFWQLYKFNNSRWESSKFDCFWSREISGDELVDRYVQDVTESRQGFSYSLPPLFRPIDVPVQDNIFSSPDARRVIESAFLKAGTFIVSLPRSPNSNMRPLGYDYLESLGFGAIFTTYRNIANNCPLALWWGDPEKSYPLNAWYPLFSRTVNTTSSLK